MLVCVDNIKAALGLPPEPDVDIDALIERSALAAQILVGAYVGFSIEQDLSVKQKLNKSYLSGTQVVRLAAWPAKITKVQIDGVDVPADQYRADSRLGVVKFRDQRTIEDLLVEYSPGFTAEDVPADLMAALENITIAVYENGGKLPAPAASGTGELKSMTMFDAMSMSFETSGGEAGAAGTPQGLVAQWAFVLDQYSVKNYVMG